MRFRNALIPIVLLPTVAADFHVIMNHCGHLDNYYTEPGLPVWTFLPSIEDNLCWNAVIAQSPSFFQRRITLGSELTAAPCGCNVTVSDRLDMWWSIKDGQNKTGSCFPVTHGTSGGNGTSVSCIEGTVAYWTCYVFDIAYCVSSDDGCSN
ncbi:uncharacterized protein EI90DRAFT_3034564 [Cantharellus anzutake]|uniref:uncharacterized protein n=1 Tax=Cantharellus anzutake TaxID=1750568 RepID=UPI001903A431|nr:uncharacterized protein EI90DRAFT_3034564 [Cantharellus anzutake]KAF8341596.1 hypothetical protein EI90DRAFT_3034564 [Cantharellus anzutake]